MRLSCLPVSFFAEIIDGRMPVAEWARLGRSLGLDAIDLSILFVQPRTTEHARILRTQIEDAGSRVAMITTYPDFTHPDPAQRLRELDQAIETVRSSPVRPVYENHAKPGAWEYTDFSTQPDIFLEITRRTAACGLGINFDTGNAASFHADPLAMLDQVIDRVVSVHVSDTAVFGELKPVEIGTGITPIAGCLRQLVAHGWDGWLCMEEASFHGQQGIAAAARFVRTAWQQARAAAPA
jgi:sugar phosphate isomerase/epimerase